MKKVIKKDKSRRELFYKFEDIRVILRSIVHNKNIPVPTRWNACLQLYKLPVNSSIIRVKRRCVTSGRRNVASHRYKFSRLEFSRYIKTGKAYGFIKASW